MSRLGQTTHYTIRIQGGVDDTFADWFGPVEIERGSDAGGQPVTTLSGDVVDQAALVGLVRHLHGLGIVLLSVERDLYTENKGVNE
ncbi:MAG: hypothetical protein R6W76_15655 [Caldilinea sp.]